MIHNGITDIHVHTVRQRYPLRFGNPTDPLSHYVAEADEVKKTLEAQGITKAVLMSGGESSSQSAYHLGAFNEDCRIICEEQNGFFRWMCNLDVTDTDTVYERLSACKNAGAVGVGEIMANQWLNSPFLTALFDAAEILHMPVLFHMSPQEGYSYGVCDHQGLPLLEELLINHPNLIVIGHSQPFWMEISGDTEGMSKEERNGFGNGPVKQGGRVTELLDRYPNLYADLSAYSGAMAIMRDREFGIFFLRRYEKRLLFATDTTNERTIFPLLEYLRNLVSEHEISQETWDAVTYENASRVLGV